MLVPLYLYGMLILLSLIWGTSFLFIKILLESYTPAAIAFLRGTFGALTLLLIIVLKKEKLFAPGTPWGKLIAVGILNTSLPWALIAFSETKLSSGLASVLNATTSLWTVIVGIVLFGAAAKWNQWFGVLIGFIGILLLSEIDWSSFTISDPIGFGAMVLATLSYAFAAQISKRYLHGLSANQTAFGTLGIGAVVSLFIALFTGPIPMQSMLDPIVLGSFFALGVLGSGVAYILYYTLILKGSAEFAAMVTYLVPPFAVMWGWLFLNEKLSLSLFVGSALILIGVYISGKKKMPSPAEAASVISAEPEHK